MRDFVVDIPISCVIDLSKHLRFPPVRYNQESEYGFAKTTSLPSGFASKDHMLSSDLTEFNTLSQQFYNQLPTCQLLYSQIREMDDALDRLPLHGGPFGEFSFKTLQEKMIIMIQLQLTFPTQIHYWDHDKDHNYYHGKAKCLDPKVIFCRISDLLSKLTHKIKGLHAAP